MSVVGSSPQPLSLLADVFHVHGIDVCHENGFSTSETENVLAVSLEFLRMVCPDFSTA